MRIHWSLIALCIGVTSVSAQSVPTYSKDIRPFIAKYCLECHNDKTQKGTLSLETHKAIMAGTDVGKVIRPGQPGASKLLAVVEGKEKPLMPPAKAKFRPTAVEIALLRRWIADGARDDSSNIKITLPAIKPNANRLPPVTALAYGKELVAARQADFLRLPGEPQIAFKHAISAMHVSPTEGHVVLAMGRPGEPGTTVLLRTGRLREHIDDLPIQHTDAILDIAFDPTGKIVASCSYDSTIQLTDVSKLTVLGEQRDTSLKAAVLYRLKEHSDAVYGLAFSPDGSLLASVSADRALKVTDVKTGKLLFTKGEATDWLYTVAWSADGKHLATGGVDKSIRVYSADAKGAKLRQSVFAHEGAVQKLVFDGESKTLYSAGQDGVIKAWDVDTMVERKVYPRQPDAILCLVLCEDVGQIAVGRYDGVVQLIDIKTGKVVRDFGAPAPKKTSAVPVRPSHFTMAQSEKTEPPSLPGASPAAARPIELPAKIVGTLDRAGAAHFFRVDVKAGQQLGMQIVKEGNAKFEPVVTIVDMQGHILSESYVGQLGYTFAQAGAYAIGVHDREYRGGADFKYRLDLGNIPVVTAVFPLGVQRGTRADVQMEGVFLPKKSVSLSVPATAKIGDVIPVPVGAGVLGKAQVVVGEFTETAGPGRLQVPGTGNGRFDTNASAQLWSFPAQKGKPLVIEVNARRLGSRLDSAIEILDSKSQPIPRAVLRSQARTHVTFRDHDSAQGNIRIETWSDLGPNDYLYVGNELMRILALPSHPDADCNFFTTAGQRIAYLDTTATHHANNTPMYKVSMHPPGSVFPPNGFPVFTLFYRNDDGGPGFGRDSRILFDPPADGEYRIRIADARGIGGVNFGYRLTVREPNPRFVLRATPQKLVVSRGSAIPITFTAERIDGFDGPIVVNPILPAGLHMPPTVIEAGTYTTVNALYADADAGKPTRIQSLVFDGRAQATRFPLMSAVVLDMPKLIAPGDLVTTVKESAVVIKPGGLTKMTVTIERSNNFTGRVPLDVKGLPHGVRVLDIGLNGILVNEKETQRTITIYAEPWVQPQEHPFVVLARREGKNTEHAAKSVLLKVK